MHYSGQQNFVKNQVETAWGYGWNQALFFWIHAKQFGGQRKTMFTRVGIFCRLVEQVTIISLLFLWTKNPAKWHTPLFLLFCWTDLLCTGLLIFRAVMVNPRNPAKFARNFTKYMSAQHIWKLSWLLGLLTCCKLANLPWNFVTAASKQHPKTTRRS